MQADSSQHPSTMQTTAMEEILCWLVALLVLREVAVVTVRVDDTRAHRPMHSPLAPTKTVATSFQTIPQLASRLRQVANRLSLWAGEAMMLPMIIRTGVARVVEALGRPKTAAVDGQILGQVVLATIVERQKPPVRKVPVSKMRPVGLKTSVSRQTDFASQMAIVNLKMTFASRMAFDSPLTASVRQTPVVSKKAFSQTIANQMAFAKQMVFVSQKVVSVSLTATPAVQMPMGSRMDRLACGWMVGAAITVVLTSMPGLMPGPRCMPMIVIPGDTVKIQGRKISEASHVQSSKLGKP